MADSFFVPDGDEFVPTELSRGPWSRDSQHGGPPAALVGTVLERRHPGDGSQITRMTCEILGPVPLAPLAVATRVARPGRRVALLEASLTSDGTEVMRARAWRMRVDDELGVPAQPEPDAWPGPEKAVDRGFFPVAWDVGYHTGMESRFLDGAFTDPGPARIWMRMRVPLLPDEEPTPLARVLIAADSGNGVSAALDFRKWLFVNTDLTVALHRLPEGEWVAMDCHTTLAPHGIGLARSELADRRGSIGIALQSLIVDRQPEVRG